MKKYLVNGATCTFDSMYEVMTMKGKMWLATCRENGKEAWIDEQNGVQFIGERRVEAKEVLGCNQQVLGCNQQVPYGYSLWGGELRDNLPHGRRYYMNRHR